MLVLADFDTAEYSLLETFLFPSPLVAHDTTLACLSPTSLAGLFLVCFPGSPSFHGLLIPPWPEGLLLAFFFSPFNLSSSKITHEYLNSNADAGGSQVSISSSHPFFPWVPDTNSCLLHSSTTTSCRHLRPCAILTKPVILCPSAACTLACISYLIRVIIQNSGPKGQMLFVFLQHNIVSDNKININRSCALLSNFFHALCLVFHTLYQMMSESTPFCLRQLDFSVVVVKSSILVATISLQEHTPTFLPLGFVWSWGRRVSQWMSQPPGCEEKIKASRSEPQQMRSGS